MDDILLHETQKVNAMKELPKILESDYDEKKLYQVKNMSLEETKENLNDVSVPLNANRKVHMELKIKIIWHIYTTKK